MTIQECYQELGGDFAALENRIPSAKLIHRFIGKFLEDGSFAELQSAMQAGQRAQAFRAAHTLKGVCGNLSLGQLEKSTSELTELLRAEADAIPDGAEPLMEAVVRDYTLTVNTIRAYLAQANEIQ